MIPIIKEKFECNVPQTFFSIDEKQSALILSLLRNNIYQYPLQSSFVESFSNALDEHVKYGITKPIDITLPNGFNNSINIRDYAKGMSKEFMLNEYTKVGLSTKSDNNDFLGGLGLGRMSPLSYADMYLVTSITEEVEGRFKREYAISKDNNKVFCSLLLEDQTEDPTGVNISYEIKDKDFNLLRSIVSGKTAFIFNIPVNIDSELVQPLAIKHKFKSFTLVSKKDCPRDFNGAVIGLLGGLPHNISIYNLNNDLSNECQRFLQDRSSSEYTLLFDIEIGSLDQSAEKNIQLSQRSKYYLATKLTQICTDMKEYINIKCNSFNKWEEANEFIYCFNLKIELIKWKNTNTSTKKWLEDIIVYSKLKKGGYKSRAEKTSYPMSYNPKYKYYYNDLNHLPSTKQMNQVFSDLTDSIVVNNIDNSFFELTPLSNFLSNKKVVASKNKKPIDIYNKCYKLSTYPGQLGRQVNINIKEQNYYISMEEYQKIYCDYSLKSMVFCHLKTNVYVINKPELVKDYWISITDKLVKDFEDLDTNYYLYQYKHRFILLNNMPMRQNFMTSNPNHIITKFLLEGEKFDKYVDKINFISTLINKNLIKFKEALFNLDHLVNDIHRQYPILKCDRLTSTLVDNMNTYIKQVDFYNQSINN